MTKLCCIVVFLLCMCTCVYVCMYYLPTYVATCIIGTYINILFCTDVATELHTLNFVSTLYNYIAKYKVLICAKCTVSIL